MDDLDVLLARLPQEYAAEAQALVEQLVRRAGESGLCVVMTAQRLTAPLARLAELVPLRANLAPGAHPRTLPGRAEVAGRTVQFAMAPSHAAPDRRPVVSAWVPASGVGAVITRAPSRVVDALTQRGVRTCSPAETAPGASIAEISADGPVVVVGDADAWQQRWSLLSQLRAAHDVVVDAACPAEYRALTGRRELPPYARPAAGRAWLLRGGETIGRIELPQRKVSERGTTS
jgi:S-DNA-T family DNA segregation ATPase FtsK/SpoIIIE